MVNDESEPATRVLKPGQPMYDANGYEVGIVQGITDLGVEVNTHDEIGTLSLEHAPGRSVGEGYLVWRCLACGELGDIERLPDRCPNCGGPREELYAYLED